MKIIFLDFDGVLNSFSSSHDTNRSCTGLEAEAQELNPDLVRLLNKIIRITGAKVVISSSWRYGKKKEELIKILEYRKFKGEIIGLTPDVFPSCRADEVQQWLDDYKGEVECFIILDDGHKESFTKQFGDSFILMEKSDGLKKKHVKKAIQILGRLN